MPSDVVPRWSRFTTDPAPVVVLPRATAALRGWGGQIGQAQVRISQSSTSSSLSTRLTSGVKVAGKSDPGDSPSG